MRCTHVDIDTLLMLRKCTGHALDCAALRHDLCCCSTDKHWWLQMPRSPKQLFCRWMRSARTR